MKLLWCWPGKMKVPMLDDEQCKSVLSFNEVGTGDLREREVGPVLQEYERITRFHETNINALYHHVISLYGSPCSNCEKPLRTPRAKLCGRAGPSWWRDRLLK